MRKPLARIATAATAAGVMVIGLGATASAASARAAPASGGHAVRVTSDAHSLHFSTTRVHEGRIKFRISTTNSNGIDLVMFRLHRGVSFAKLDADLQEEFDPATAAKGTRDLTRDVTFYGLADAQPGTPVTATVNLEDGTYYATDTNSPALPTAQSVTRLHVLEGGNERSERGLARHHLASVSMTSRDRFVVRGRLPAHGSVLVKNVSDTIHFMDLQRVAAGTTDAQVQAYFDSGVDSPPTFVMDGPGVSTDVMSPGKQLVLGYKLPRGTYVLLCFIADDATGMFHAGMGMHKVVVLG
ncbi:MAG: hypothetical protein ACR2LX_12905 [Jatrophihabitans sp.]